MSWAAIRTEPPTEKQVKYAKDIAWTLHLNVDLNSMDKWQMRDFISEHVRDFKRERTLRMLKAREESIRWRRRNGFYSDSDFGCGGDDPICDCFDFGIYPWGDS